MKFHFDKKNLTFAEKSAYVTYFTTHDFRENPDWIG